MSPPRLELGPLGRPPKRSIHGTMMPHILQDSLVRLVDTQTVRSAIVIGAI